MIWYGIAGALTPTPRIAGSRSRVLPRVAPKAQALSPGRFRLPLIALLVAAVCIASAYLMIAASHGSGASRSVRLSISGALCTQLQMNPRHGAANSLKDYCTM
jgi:hypothetical protein